MLFTQTLLFASLSFSILASPLHFKRQDSISAQVQATPTLSNQDAEATPAETAIPAGGGAQPQDSTPTSSTVGDTPEDDTEAPEQDDSNDSSPQEVQDASDYSPDYSSIPDNAQVAAGDSPSTLSDGSSTPSNETADESSTPDSSPPSDPSAPSDSSTPDDLSSDGSSSDDSTPSESTPDESASDSSSPDGTIGTDGAGNDNDDNYFAGDDWFDGTK